VMLQFRNTPPVNDNSKALAGVALRNTTDG
jgi:hypothetical protein